MKMYYCNRITVTHTQRSFLHLYTGVNKRATAIEKEEGVLEAHSHLHIYSHAQNLQRTATVHN